jgi:hypothetical protein
MKTFIYTAMGLLCASIVVADPIDSKVIHNYNQFGVGYNYVDADGTDGHGVVGTVSVDLSNFLLGAGGNYVWYDEFDAESWSATAFAGYIVRLMENHINIIPRVGIAYNEISTDAGPFGFVENVVTLEPGITLSYAINNRISLNGGYTYVQDIESDDLSFEAAHTFSVGTSIALVERLGLNLNALFEEEQGFSGVTAILSWHF